MCFLWKGVVALYCFDNFLLFTQTNKLSDESFASLKEYFLCANEGEACGHLGIEIKTTDNVLTLKQKKTY